MNRATFTLILMAFCLTLSTHTFAFPELNLTATTPNIHSSFITVDYVGNNTSGNLTASGFATSLTPPGPTAGNIAGGTFDINASINFSGQSASGTLTIGGTIAALGFNSGSLLTGTFTSTSGDQTFGAGSGDPLEFLFTVTGGDAAPLYGGVGGLAGVILGNSGFTGSFASNFSGGAFASGADAFMLLPPPPVPTVITANGEIESTSGGFKFPDGTVQTTAASGGADLMYQFVGFTNDRVSGLDIGALYEACQDYTANPNARMASTREFIQSPNAVLPARPAWIRPSIMGVSRDDFDSTIQVDISGAAFKGDVGCLAAYSAGITISDDGTLTVQNCDTLHVVACSVPASGLP